MLRVSLYISTVPYWSKKMSTVNRVLRHKFLSMKLFNSAYLIFSAMIISLYGKSTSYIVTKTAGRFCNGRSTKGLRMVAARAQSTSSSFDDTPLARNGATSGTKTK